jgi:UMF1 family MFS transporter
MGLQTVMNMATDFGTREMKLETGNLIIALLIIQLIAIPGAIFFAALSKRKSNIYALKIAVSIWVGICIAAYYIINEWQFYVLGALVGFVMGGIQSISRATYAKLLPQAHNTNASFFSLYSVTDKVATVFGTLVFGLTTQYTGSMRNATLFLIVFFVGGFILLWRTNWSLGVHVPINEPEEVQ